MNSPDREEARAQVLCVRLLAQRPRTETQLAEAMRKRGFDEVVAEEVMQRLRDGGLVDDAAFAKEWVRQRHSMRGLARPVLVRELRQRGVAEDLIEKACAQLDGDDEEEAVRALVARRFSAVQGLPYETQVRRLAAYVARRGYAPALAERIARNFTEITTPSG